MPSSRSNPPCLAPQAAAALLADRLPARLLIPYLLSALALAVAYGASFLLVDALRAAGFDAADAGTVISIGTVATLIGAGGAGRLAQRVGILPVIATAAVVMALAMACFALAGTAGIGVAYAGGVLLGLGWALFYMLAPIQLIHCLKPAARLEALTLLSGSQMLGLGLAAPLGHFLAARCGGSAFTFAAYAALCVLAAVLAWGLRRPLARLPQLPLDAVALTPAAMARVMGSRTALPVLMVAFSACTFAGLSTFQSLYARPLQLTPDTFFLTFTLTTVALRFSVASLIGRLPLRPLALCLFLVTLAGIALLAVNPGSAWLYAGATVLFATGYGLTYSTLNAMVVNFAGESNLSIPVASQVFTLGYFAGAFGFPYVAGKLIAAHGVSVALGAMMALVVVNIVIAGAVLQRSRNG
ncbi:MFS transporter [Achromobacter xylosoxidans]|uniref:MFS transporter n=1 Tax=Alcaligenes xylosoxydans xylosoxydans TaxID=85698 RepID=A0A2L0PTB8_ALCXX|nr:MFS transporter [Achromobacter xylosoxidans]AUZ17967.1 MFS transporter [Achromobacter xylosoxidans]